MVRFVTWSDNILHFGLHLYMQGVINYQSRFTVGSHPYAGKSNNTCICFALYTRELL